MTWDIFRLVFGSLQIATCYDHDPEMTLSDFFKESKKSDSVTLDNLVCYVFILGDPARGYRRTKHNPDGISPAAGMQKYKNAFFQSAINPDQKSSFSARLSKIDFSKDNIPQKFLDPITYEIMDNPVITSSQRVFDRNIIMNKLGNIDPYSKEALSLRMRPHLALRSEIEQFVCQQEKLFALLEK